jgi:hypothetical protein
MQDSHLHMRPLLKPGATVAIGDIGKIGPMATGKLEHRR